MNASDFSISEAEISDLRQNAVPAPEAYTALKQSIRAAEYRLSTLSALPGSSDSTQESRDIERYIAFTYSRLAPVRRLPPELLSRIFLDVLTIPPASKPRTVGVTLPPAICAVSSHWRAVAHSTPQLWSDFRVDISRGDRTLYDLERYLTRTRNCDIPLDVMTSDFQKMVQVNHAIVAALVQTSERWGSVTFYLPLPDLSLFAGIRGRLSALRSLSLLYNERDAMLEGLDIFKIAPNLGRVFFAGIERIPPLPTDQILEITVEYYDVSDLVRVAANFPRLETLSCSRAPPATSILRRENVLRMSALTFCGSRSASLCDFISAPNLLNLDIRDDNFGWDILPFGDFLARSGCFLKSISLENVNLHGNDLLQLFPLIPSVESFTFISLRPNALLDKVMAALTLSTSAQPLLPDLRSLTISGSYLFSTGAFLRMLESRAFSNGGGSGTGLERLDLMIGHRQFSAEEIHRLRSVQGVKSTVNLHKGAKPHVKVI